MIVESPRSHRATKKATFIVFTFFISLLSLEVGLRVIYYNLNSDHGLAIVSALMDLVRVWDGANRPQTQTPKLTYKDFLDIDDTVLAELTAQKAVIQNAMNPTGVKEHDTILVQPDSDLEYTLRPNKVIKGFLLKGKRRPNFDPPVLYMDANETVSDRLRAFIARQAILAYSYTVNRDGFRATVPVVDSDRQILIVGDSVGFGVGVTDDKTAASYLQRQVGAAYRIVNASVGGYDGWQILRVARKLGKARRFDGLIYIACQNDFMRDPQKQYAAVAGEVLEELATLKPLFRNRIIVVLETYMEYTLDDVLGRWSSGSIKQTNVLKETMRAVSSKYGFAYVDYTELASAHMKSSGSSFSRFALYFDHVHLSPLGNRLLASEMRKALQAIGLI